MNNDLKQTEKKLADAEAVQAKTQAEFAKVTVELESLDTSTGDLDKLVDRQIKLGAKKTILEQRIKLAGQAVEVLRGDVLIAKSEDAARVLDAATEKLDKAMAKARAEIMALIADGLQPREIQSVGGVVAIHRDVLPLIRQREALACRAREAAGCAANVIRQRSNAEGKERAAMQEKVFNGAI